MTSSLGTEFMSAATPLGFASGDAEATQHDIKQKVMGRLREFMRPEFLNRIDDTLLFSPLSRKQLREIVGLQLQDSENRLAAQGITLEVDEAARDWIAETGYEPAYGARPLRRVIQRQLDDKIADLLVAESVDRKSVVRERVERKVMAVEVKKNR